ncbi:Kinesin-associated protein 3 [Entophlyctis sp. JEL0112]|nr:Kinesin-associated protein 3 [Entophlyctis sp. JEL0112]
MDDTTKKKITYVNTEVHPSESAIVVNYYLQLIAVTNAGRQTASERKSLQKVIKVRISEQSEISAVAREIIEKYPKLIPAIKMRELEACLKLLQERGGSVPELAKGKDGAGGRATPMSIAATASNMLEAYSRNGRSSPIKEEASLDMIENYIEGLYEDISEKVISTRNILALAKNPQNLDVLMGNESLISAISRTLREDNKKSMELVTNIIYIFFCFSNFPQYHPFITANKVGDMCLRVTDQELNRFNLWSTDLAKLEARSVQSRDPAIVRELEKEHRKFQAMIKKQDQLLFVCFHLLLNLAEDISIEVKMVKRNIVQYLLKILGRETPELLLLTITFLKKLSIFRENKDELVQSDSVYLKIERILSIENSSLQSLSLRFLLNLSHDSKFRTIMVENGCIIRLMEFLHSKTHVIPCLQLLYQMSIDDRNRDVMSSADIMRMILEYRGERVNAELMALAINLATTKRNAELIAEDNGIKFLIRRALKSKDTCIFKMLKNISIHEGEIQYMFLEQDYIDELLLFLLKNVSEPEVFVEVVGILANLNIADFDFVKLSQSYSLLDLVQKKLAYAVATVSGSTKISNKSNDDSDEDSAIARLAEDDDITLEVIMLLGTMAHDENIAPIVARSDTLQLLMDLMIIKEEDDEIVLQIIYCVYHFLLYESTRNILINKTQIVSFLIDLLYDRNREIRKMCDEINDEWVKKIKNQKFQWHNSEYLGIMAELLVQQEEAQVVASNRKATAGTEGLATKKVAIGSRTYYSRLNESDEGSSSDNDDDFETQIGGTRAILDGP